MGVWDFKDCVHFFLIMVATALIITPILVHIIERIDRGLIEENNRIWEECIEYSSEYTVYCLGQVVDMGRVKFSALCQDNWYFVIDHDEREIYLNPVDIGELEDECKVLLPLKGLGSLYK